MNTREQKGREIAARLKIVRKDNKWIVPSQTGKGKYTVDIDGEVPHCTCPDYELGGLKCKHIYAVEYTMKSETDPETQTTTITRTMRVTYKQDWPAYNAAQTNEKAHFQALLHDLCQGIDEPDQHMGRPHQSLQDMLFSMVFKVYSTISTRRFNGDLEEACAKGYLTSVPHFNTIVKYFDNASLTPLLRTLIQQSSLCLKSVDVDFAVDSSGFSTSRYVRWYNARYGHEQDNHDWMKVHLMTGVKTNIVTSVEITGRYSNDSPHFDLRIKTLECIEELTGRPIICYIAKTLGNPHFLLPNMTPLEEAVDIDDNDMLGFRDLIESTPGPIVDVLLVSNGGSPLAAERIVRMLRRKFSHIRFIVPANAFSAATMICFSGDEVIMNSMTSTLGPIDPQYGSIPVRTVIRGLEEIEKRYDDKEGQIILDIYGILINKLSIPFLEKCKSAMGLSQELGKGWLKDYMFRDAIQEGKIDECQIDEIVTAFLNYDEHKDHGRSIARDKAREMKLKIKNAEDVEGLDKMIESIYNQYEKWFEVTRFFKMFEITRGISWGRETKAVVSASSQPTSEESNQT